ncbi:hypothetical protein B9H02_03645 [Prosthecochloris sp. HL-130-GSB]|nr:hypothetical protein B9H02_03645 [Prosthecochloris sp. HL-130-GSB]
MVAHLMPFPETETNYPGGYTSPANVLLSAHIVCKSLFPRNIFHTVNSTAVSESYHDHYPA